MAVPFKEETAQSVLGRFYECNDGLIRRVTLGLGASKAESSAEVVLSVKDSESESGWSNLALTIKEITEFSLTEGVTTYRVLSDGLRVWWFEGIVFIDLGPYTSEPEGIEDIRRSGFYIAGRACSWEVVPYSEQA